MLFCVVFHVFQPLSDAFGGPCHNENKAIQIYCRFYQQKKNENFQIKNSDIFHISALNIDCGYSLEPPR